MILRSGLKPEAFLSALACTIGADAHYRLDAEVITPEKTEYYLAGGYWRALAVWNGDDLIGVRLVNPDRTTAECHEVEKGIAVLRHLTWITDPHVFEPSHGNREYCAICGGAHRGQ